MIYGYASQTVDDNGLLEMQEVSIEASPAMLRELAKFLVDAAGDLEAGVSHQWHKHVPSQIGRSLACDFIVLSDRPAPQL